MPLFGLRIFFFFCEKAAAAPRVCTRMQCSCFSYFGRFLTVQLRKMPTTENSLRRLKMNFFRRTKKDQYYSIVGSGKESVSVCQSIQHGVMFLVLQGVYSPTILKNFLSLVLQGFSSIFRTI